MLNKIPYCLGIDVPSTVLIDEFGEFFESAFERRTHLELINCEKFICVIPLVTTYCLISSVKSVMLDPNKHLFEMIHEHILAAASDGRCLLVFDASPEGDKYIHEAYQDLHAWLDDKAISRHNVVILTQNRVLGEIYRSHHGDVLKFVTYDSFIKKLLNIFALPDEDLIRAVGFGCEQISYRGALPDRKTFLSLNGAPRDNRIVVVAGLWRSGILEDCEWSMLGAKSRKLDVNRDAARQFRNNCGLDWIDDEAIDYVIDAMPKYIDIENSAMKNISGSDELAVKINSELFKAAFWSIATETDFTDGSVYRISELSIKAYAMGHPQVIIGNPHSLDIISSIGFKTFSEVIDESFDRILDPGSRLNAIVEELKKISAIRQSGNEDTLRKVEKVCEYNIQLARSGQAARNYEVLMEKPLVGALTSALASMISIKM